MNNELPVIISGAGPTGLTLALALGKAGIKVELFEAEADLADEIRASTIHASTLELWDDLGVADAIIKKGKITHSLQYWERETKTLVAEFDYGLLKNDTRYPFRLQCPQNIVTRQLMPAVEATGNVTIHMSHPVKRFEDHGDNVTLFVDSPEGEKAITGNYVVACDGPRSPEREQLGIQFPNLSVLEDRFLLIGTDIDLTQTYPGIGPVAYFYDPEEWIICMQLPEMTRTVFRIPPDEATEGITCEASCRKRLSKVVGDDCAYDIKVVNYYSVIQRAAETFRVGRVILAGDAGHLNNPTGGQGLNSGAQDAGILAKKLIDVLRGRPDSALDEYSRERSDYAANMVQAKATKNYSELVLTDAEERAERNRSMALIAKDNSQAREFLLRSAMLDDRI